MKNITNNKTVVYQQLAKDFKTLILYTCQLDCVFRRQKMKVLMLILAGFSIAALFIIAALQLARLMFAEMTEIVTDAWQNPNKI